MSTAHRTRPVDPSRADRARGRHRRGFRVARDNLVGLRRMIAVRVAIIAAAMVVLSAVMFWLADLSPFDPVGHYLGDEYGRLTPEERAEVARAIGADRSWIEQWWRWLVGVFQGDLGYSRVYSRPVAQVIAERLPWTLALSAVGLTLMTALALLLGVAAGRRPGGHLDRAIVGLGVFIAATPSYVYALGAVLVFAVWFRVIPIGGAGPIGSTPTFWGMGPYIIAPALVLAVSQLSWPLLAVREATLEALGSDAVTAARARGVPQRLIMRRHVAPLALMPLLTLICGRLGELVVGAVIVESVFLWPGVAQATVESAIALDFPLLAILTVATTLVVMGGSLLADVGYLLIDPRVTDV